MLHSAEHLYICSVIDAGGGQPRSERGKDRGKCSAIRRRRQFHSLPILCQHAPRQLQPFRLDAFADYSQMRNGRRAFQSPLCRRGTRPPQNLRLGNRLRPRPCSLPDENRRALLRQSDVDFPITDVAGPDINASGPSTSTTDTTAVTGRLYRIRLVTPP
jgi:hypothetical protein